LACQLFKASPHAQKTDVVLLVRWAERCGWKNPCTFTLRSLCLDISARVSFLNMLSQAEMMEKPMTTESRKTLQIRQKIKEIFGWDCTMNDDMLLKRYTVTSDGELIVIVK
jgi:hypothetical protein